MDTFNFDGVEIPIVGYRVMGIGADGMAIMRQFEGSCEANEFAAEITASGGSSVTVAPIVDIVTEETD